MTKQELLNYFSSEEAFRAVQDILNANSSVKVYSNGSWLFPKTYTYYCYYKHPVESRLIKHTYFGRIDESHVFWDIVDSVCRMEEKEPSPKYERIKSIVDAAYGWAEFYL